jgi:hypothetical protein
MAAIVLIAFVLTASLALLTQDHVDKWYKKRKKGIYMECWESAVTRYHSVKTQRHALVVKKRMGECLARHGITKTVWGTGEEHNPYNIELYNNVSLLTPARHAFREFYGRWTDKAEASGCRGGDVQVAYKQTMGLTDYVEIRCDYPLDDLPGGFLKESCRIERRTETVERCEIVCET